MLWVDGWSGRRDPVVMCWVVKVAKRIRSLNRSRFTGPLGVMHGWMLLLVCVSRVEGGLEEAVRFGERHTTHHTPKTHTQHKKKQAVPSFPPS
jgi:hypothetical protein